MTKKILSHSFPFNSWNNRWYCFIPHENGPLPLPSPKKIDSETCMIP